MFWRLHTFSGRMGRRRRRARAEIVATADFGLGPTAAEPMRPIALSFSGSGHLLCYQLGVARTLLSPDCAWGRRIQYFAGASGGAIAAALCALLPPPRLAEFAEAVACQGRSYNGISELLHGDGPFANPPVGSGWLGFMRREENFPRGLRRFASPSGSRFWHPPECQCGRASCPVPLGW